MKIGRSTMKIIYKKISDINPYPENAKKHDKKQIQLVANSIERFGWMQPLVIDKNDNLIIGHCRLDSAKLLGQTEVPVVVAENITDDEIKALRLADNKLNESAWDMDLVIKELKEIPDLIDLTGFDRDLLIELDEKDDEVPEVPEEPKSKLGDLYELGQHRVLCGDSTKKEDVERLMDGKLSDMIHTDPPYNIDYGVSKNPRHKIRTIEGDKQSDEGWDQFCNDIYANFKLYNKGDIYMWGASSPEGMKMRLWLTEMGCHWSATIIWKKDRLVLTPANYQRMYEPCFYGWFGKSTYNGSRKEVEVWELKRPSNSKLHPTMKPIEVCEKAIINSSKERDIVMDLFLGSGSTLIACEKTNRMCYGMELDPKYIDVIVQRYVDYTGNNNIKLNGQEILWEKK
jgi:DNA modification methylase